MANALYDKGREHFLGATLDWDGFDIRVTSIDEADHTPNLSTHEDLADIGEAGAREFVSGALASKTIVAGTADAADLSPAFTSASGDTFESIVIYYHTGTDSTAFLIANIDTAAGLALTPEGNNIDITWSSGSDKIFTL